MSSMLIILKVIIMSSLTESSKKYMVLLLQVNIYNIQFFCFSGHSQELHSMLQNRHLREMIREIDSSEDPGKLLGHAMQIPIFTEFADECLRIVEPQDENEMVH